jgi:hypothetical protein
MPVPKERRILGGDRLKGVKINVGYPPSVEAGTAKYE